MYEVSETTIYNTLDVRYHRMVILDKQKIKTSHRAAQLMASREFLIVRTEGVLDFCGCCNTLAQN